MKQQSIARRLIVSVLLIQLISALGLIGATVAHERRTHFEAFDVMLRGRADSLLGAVQDADDEADDVMLDQANLHLPSGDVYEVKDAAGRVLGASTSWGQVAAVLPEHRGDGIFQEKVGDVTFRMIRLHANRVVDPGKANGGTVRPVVIVYGAQTSGVWRQIREAVLFYTVASALLLILTGALVAWLLHRGLLPLRELAAEAEGVSVERWSFQSPESARSTMELAPLANALESAVSRLEQSFEQQRHFVSDAAHELKTAVAVIKSSLQLLTMRRRSAEDYANGLHRSLSDCERIEGIVLKMLTLARLESRPAAGVAKHWSDLAACAAMAMEQLRPIAELRGVKTIHVSTMPGYVALSTEECALLCSNLLMNALQHSRRGEQVELRVGLLDGSGIELRVVDHGEGIDEPALAHVFERFYRGDASRARKTGGTGLGLAICRAIVQRAGGTIHLESVRGAGTTAIVRLPMADETSSGFGELRVSDEVSSA